MLIGCCTGVVDNVRAAMVGGADFIEVGLSQLMARSDEDFSAWADALKEAGPTVHASNAFMPAELKVTGPVVDRGALDAYVATAAERMSRLGITVAVFGSSGARNVPDGFDHREARGQFAAFLTSTAAVLKPYGIALALEPLCAAESNIINTVAEGLQLIREECSGVNILADSFHMLQAAEPLDVLADAGDLLKHTHISTFDRRGTVYADAHAEAFVRALFEIGYEGGCSLECGWDDFVSEIGKSVKTLQGWAA